MPIDLTTVIVSGLGAMTGVAALISSRSAHKEVRAKVDKEAYDTAKEFYESTLVGYKQELHEARAELDDTRLKLQETAQSLETERSDRKFLQIRLHELELHVKRLEQRLQAAGLPLDDEDPR